MLPAIFEEKGLKIRDQYTQKVITEFDYIGLYEFKDSPYENPYFFLLIEAKTTLNSFSAASLKGQIFDKFPKGLAQLITDLAGKEDIHSDIPLGTPILSVFVYYKNADNTNKLLEEVKHWNVFSHVKKIRDKSSAYERDPFNSLTIKEILFTALDSNIELKETKTIDQLQNPSKGMKR